MAAAGRLTTTFIAAVSNGEDAMGSVRVLMVAMVPNMRSQKVSPGPEKAKDIGTIAPR